MGLRDGLQLPMCLHPPCGVLSHSHIKATEGLQACKPPPHGQSVVTVTGGDKPCPQHRQLGTEEKKNIMRRRRKKAGFPFE